MLATENLGGRAELKIRGRKLFALRHSCRKTEDAEAEDVGFEDGDAADVLPVDLSLLNEMHKRLAQWVSYVHKMLRTRLK